MKSHHLASLHLPFSASWRRSRHLANASHFWWAAKAPRKAKGDSFDETHQPLWAITNGIAIFFLVMTAVAFLLLMVDAFLTRH